MAKKRLLNREDLRKMPNFLNFMAYRLKLKGKVELDEAEKEIRKVMEEQGCSKEEAILLVEEKFNFGRSALQIIHQDPPGFQLVPSDPGALPLQLVKPTPTPFQVVEPLSRRKQSRRHR